jgi:2-C-methyl-D-erythritol 4-phosphate cytidylyltransferase
MNLSVIITAGGVGKRFSSEVPKQFLSLMGTPVLMRTLNSFFNWNPMNEIILTLPTEWISYWEKLVKKHDFKIPHRIVDGGNERYHSIKNALDMCSGDFVMIHDGVRPLVDKGTLNRCLDALKNNKAVVPYIEIKDSIRKLIGANSVSRDRKNYVVVQTPQCFDLKLIHRAYQGEYQEVFTDDASVAENNGLEIYLVKGNEENLKITTPIDFKIAESLIKK